MREEENQAVGRFAEVLDRGHPFGITGVIYQEVLQGAALQAKFDYLAEYLSTQRFYHLRDPVFSYGGCTVVLPLPPGGSDDPQRVDCLIA